LVKSFTKGVRAYIQTSNDYFKTRSNRYQLFVHIMLEIMYI